MATCQDMSSRERNAWVDVVGRAGNKDLEVAPRRLILANTSEQMDCDWSSGIDRTYSTDLSMPLDLTTRFGLVIEE